MRHLRNYRAIRLIQRYGSIRKAAEKLAVSPSALNRSIQAFEDELGMPVFERIPSGVRLSTVGELLFDIADRHLTEFDNFHGTLSGFRDGLAGDLRVSIGADINAGLVMQAIVDFEESSAKVGVEIVQSDSCDMLHRRLVDLAILTDPVTDDGVEVLMSHPIPLVAWHSGDMPMEAGVWALSERRLLVPPEATGTRRRVSHVLRRHALTPSVLTTVSAAEIAQRQPSATSLALLPACATGPSGARQGALDIGRVQLSVLRVARAPMPRPAQAFFARLQARLETGPDWSHLGPKT